MSADSSTPETIRALVRDLLAETPPGEGPIRIEDWSEWASRQRGAGLRESTPD
ncbi:MAG TPA: hypothetical protein VJU18_18285 [Vicinamibacteria bacterium]|nr:hypothetical protein [Vicinamibacteria bacterium]